MITEQEARAQNLPGSDVFKRIHLAYRDELNRDAFVVSLNNEAYKILLTSNLIRNYPIFREESLKLKKALADGTFSLANYILPMVHRQSMEYINLEHFYIATGLELYFKSYLLQNDYVVNIFEDKEPYKELKKEQKKRPIHKGELFNISGYYYDQTRQINILRGITDKSLDFGVICNTENYISVLDVSNNIVGIAEDYRNLRNQIHLPGDFNETKYLSTLGENFMPTMVLFINSNIVDKTNDLIKKWGLNYVELVRLDFFD